MRVHTDTRRRFVADLFPTKGDVNVVYLYPGDPIAWHRHQKQTDWIFCAMGKLTVGIVAPGRKTPTIHFLDPLFTDVVSIPPNHWHGYQATAENTIIVSYLTQKYDPQDEERTPLETFPWPTTA